MLRLLIASADEAIVSQVKEQLQGEYLIESCGSGKWALELLGCFSPDLLLLDAYLTDVDCITVQRGLRASGKRVRTIFISRLLDEYTVMQMTNLGVDCILPKPCKGTLLISHICGLGYLVLHPDDKDWHVDMEIDNILLDLGFRVGPDRYRLLKEAIIVRYYDQGNMLMKQLYAEVVRKHGGNVLQVEKAIRDCIRAARDTGEPETWGLLFRTEKHGEKYCPSNEELINRIVVYLAHRSRIKPPYKELPAMIV